VSGEEGRQTAKWPKFVYSLPRSEIEMDKIRLYPLIFWYNQSFCCYHLMGVSPWRVICWLPSRAQTKPLGSSKEACFLNIGCKCESIDDLLEQPPDLNGSNQIMMMKAAPLQVRLKSDNSGSSVQLYLHTSKRLAPY
jgi:hypothetical protein